MTTALRRCDKYKLWTDPKYCAPWRKRAEAEKNPSPDQRYGWSAHNRKRKTVEHHEHCAGCPVLIALGAPELDQPAVHHG